jgi:DNA-binding transcriptional LysR family regulator
MRLRHLEVIWAVARCKSMREAAMLLGVSQPALSQSLKHAENLLGYDLFSRERGRLVPTPELRGMMPDIERVFASVNDIRARSVEMTRSQRGEIMVVAIPALSGDWLARATIRFRRLHPRVKVRILSATARLVTESILEHRADIGLLHGPVANPSLQASKLGENRIVAALQRSHPLATRETIGPRDLLGFDVIAPGTGNAPGDLVAAVFRKANQILPISVEITASASSIIFVREGAGVALMDSRTAETFTFPDVLIRPFVPSITLHAEAVVAVDRALTKHSVTFLSMLRGCRAGGVENGEQRGQVDGRGRRHAPRSAC